MQICGSVCMCTCEREAGVCGSVGVGLRVCV